jgi:hypothetical protein
VAGTAMFRPAAGSPKFHVELVAKIMIMAVFA